MSFDETSRVLPQPLDYVAGSKQAPEQQAEVWLCDPNTGEPLQRQVVSADRVVDQALDHARALHEEGSWARSSLLERADRLEQVAGGLKRATDHVALLDARTTGVALSQTRRLAAITGEAFRGAAKQLRAGWMVERFDGPHSQVERVRKPWGPAAIIAPWNAPTPIVAHKVASALAAGCPVIVKPSEWSPHGTAFIAEACQLAGLPRGLVQVVHGAGETGGRIVRSPSVRAVSFTGGGEAGRSVAHACAEQIKPVQLELGGNNPLIVLEDADVNLAAEGIVTGLTTLNGQWCRAVGRLLVHESKLNSLLDRTLSRLAKVRLGSSLDTASDMGPLIHAGHLDRVRTAIEGLARVGGEPLHSTSVPELSGYFLPPTIVRGAKPEDALQEIFGPVATLHAFQDDDEAVALSNQAPYGLAAYVFSGDESRAFRLGRRLETGMVKINGVTMLALSPDAPRPAWKQSGLGHEGARHTIEFFCGDTVIGVAGHGGSHG